VEVTQLHPIIMRNEDIVQDLSFLGLRYARILTDDISNEEAARLVTTYSYVHIYSGKQAALDGFQERLQPTPIIDLTQNLDDIFKKFRRDTRAGIKKSGEINDLRFLEPTRNIDESYDFYKYVKKRDGVLPDLKREFAGCIFFNAYLDNRLLVSMSFYDNGITLRSKHIVSLRKEIGSRSKLVAFATRRLVWDVCQYAKERKYLKLDLGGINFSDSVKSGVADFKQSFGADIVNFYVYRYETRQFSLARRTLNVIGKNIL